MTAYADDMKKANQQDARTAVRQLESVNFADALGETSVRTRRALLALSVIAVVFAWYPVNVKQIPWLEIPAPEQAANLVPMLLFVALVYHWLSFALYGIADVAKWEVNRDIGIFSARSQLVYRLDEHVRQLGLHLEQLPKTGELAKWREVNEPIADQAREVATNAIAEWKNYYRVTLWGFRVKRFAAWGWELCLPLVFGAWAAFRLFTDRLQ